ncbi:hypothetical protein ACOSQ3_004941 [Xanthoceras sorbifolium]
MNAQNSWLCQSNVNVIFLENQNILTIHIDSTLPSPSFYALPLFTNSSIPPCTTSNQIPTASVTSLAPSPTVDLVPATVDHECWRKAIETKLLALEENQIWDVVLCPPSVKPIGSKWVFSIKLCSDGS